MVIDWCKRTRKFIISKVYGSENNLLHAMPDARRWPSIDAWKAPALKQTIGYMRANMGNEATYSPDAWDQLNKTQEIKPNGTWPEWHPFKNKPMKHQLAALRKGFGYDAFGHLLEQGLGKTFCAINLSAAWFLDNQINAVLVICPSAIKMVWDEELETHCPMEYQFHVLKAGRVKAVNKWLAEDKTFPWLIVGVEALSKGGAYDIAVNYLKKYRCCTIIDESSAIKSHKANRTKKAIALGEMSVKRQILTGTMITQGAQDFYTQFKFLDPRIIGFDSYYTFQARYCVMQRIQVTQTQFRDDIVGYQNEQELLESAAPFCIRVEKKDALDLPEKIFQKRYIEMTAQQKKAYKELDEDLATVIDGEDIELTTILEKILRLQQITGGFYPHDNGEYTESKAIPGKNPKVEETLQLLAEIPGKVIIWCKFLAEVTVLRERFRKEDISFVEFHGHVAEDDRKRNVTQFRQGDTKVFLCSYAAHRGLTLVEASYAIYYTSDYSLEKDAQSQDRNHRIGQYDPCTYIRLVCPGTVDIKVLSALEKKVDVAQLFYEGLK